MGLLQRFNPFFTTKRQALHELRRMNTALCTSLSQDRVLAAVEVLRNIPLRLDGSDDARVERYLAFQSEWAGMLFAEHFRAAKKGLVKHLPYRDLLAAFTLFTDALTAYLVEEGILVHKPPKGGTHPDWEDLYALLLGTLPQAESGDRSGSEDPAGRKAEQPDEKTREGSEADRKTSENAQNTQENGKDERSEEKEAVSANRDAEQKESPRTENERKSEEMRREDAKQQTRGEQKTAEKGNRERGAEEPAAKNRHEMSAAMRAALLFDPLLFEALYGPDSEHTLFGRERENDPNDLFFGMWGKAPKKNDEISLADTELLRDELLRSLDGKDAPAASDTEPPAPDPTRDNLAEKDEMTRQNAADIPDSRLPSHHKDDDLADVNLPGRDSIIVPEDTVLDSPSINDYDSNTVNIFAEPTNTLDSSPENNLSKNLLEAFREPAVPLSKIERDIERSFSSKNAPEDNALIPPGRN